MSTFCPPWHSRIPPPRLYKVWKFSWTASETGAFEFCTTGSEESQWKQAEKSSKFQTSFDFWCHEKKKKSQNFARVKFNLTYFNGMTSIRPERNTDSSCTYLFQKQLRDWKKSVESKIKLAESAYVNIVCGTFWAWMGGGAGGAVEGQRGGAEKGWKAGSIVATLLSAHHCPIQPTSQSKTVHQEKNRKNKQEQGVREEEIYKKQSTLTWLITETTTRARHNHSTGDTQMKRGGINCMQRFGVAVRRGQRSIMF